MADERTVNDVRIYRDSAGNVREYPIEQPGPIASGAVSGTDMLYRQFTADQLSTSQRLAPPVGATLARVESNGGTAVRYRGDGTDPTPAIGMLIVPGDFRMFSGDLTQVAFIDQGGNAVLDVTYYG